jgi:2-hydroxy-4-carboxymuconate semialdehyde hemiacetal dehydrogenase
MKVCMVGEGAQAETHMNALRSLDGVEVVTVAGGIEADMEAFAQKWNIPHCSLDLETCLNLHGVEAVINTGPSQLHAAQTRLAVSLGKHVLLEIPMALSLADCEELANLEEELGVTCMVCHTRHFQTGMRALKQMILDGDLQLHHIVLQTYFFRRVNINRFGEPRTWKDDLLWHHACHAVDMTRWLLDDDGMRVWAQVGPNHPELGIPMDLSIGIKSPKTGVITTIAHSFNNHGEIQTPMRFIGEEETYTFVGGVLADHAGNEVAKGTPNAAVVRQNREFFSAIAEQREPETSFRKSLASMRYLDQAQRCIDADS